MRGLVDCWIVGLLDWWMKEFFGFMEFTKRRNLNRGYMKLDAWQRGMDLFAMAFRLCLGVSDFKLKSQFTDAAQSVSANIAEGYGRRSLPEYLQFLYVAKGSLAEALIRSIGLRLVSLITEDDFERFDTLHYEVENKLLRLIESLEKKRGTNQWCDTLPFSPNPTIHSSTNPTIPKSTNPKIPSSNHPAE